MNEEEAVNWNPSSICIRLSITAHGSTRIVVHEGSKYPGEAGDELERRG